MVGNNWGRRGEGEEDEGRKKKVVKGRGGEVRSVRE